MLQVCNWKFSVEAVMAKELAFVLINPYTIGKSRTGGVIGRIISKTGLDLVAARMFGPSRDLVEKHADLVRNDKDIDPSAQGILADYILRAYMPDQKTGLRQRVMMLLFEGDDAIQMVRDAVGHVRQSMASGRTVRDIYGDFIVDDEGKVLYVEPAVLIGASVKSSASRIDLWAEYTDADGGIIENTGDLEENGEVEKTLVLIKPDNFRFPSGRPGNIIDMFSASGLRIIGAKIHRMTVAEAEEFYGPVRNVLRKKLKGYATERAAHALSERLGFDLGEETMAQISDLVGPEYGDHQFYEIIRFMTGKWAPDCSEEEKAKCGEEKCLALVYAGVNAVNIIRGILGPTDPSKAEPGSVRREFGQNVMVNAAHASDSPENAKRELGIIDVDKDTIKPWAEKY